MQNLILLAQVHANRSRPSVNAAPSFVRGARTSRRKTVVLEQHPGPKRRSSNKPAPVSSSSTLGDPKIVSPHPKPVHPVSSHVPQSGPEWLYATNSGFGNCIYGVPQIPHAEESYSLTSPTAPRSSLVEWADSSEPYGTSKAKDLSLTTTDPPLESGSPPLKIGDPLLETGGIALETKGQPLKTADPPRGPAELLFEKPDPPLKAGDPSLEPEGPVLERNTTFQLVPRHFSTLLPATSVLLVDVEGHLPLTLNPHADQFIYNFFNKVCLLVSEARLTIPCVEGRQDVNESRSAHTVDISFDLETPDQDQFKSYVRTYVSILTSYPTCMTHATRPLNISILLLVPRLLSNQALMLTYGDRYVCIDPAPRYILLETWHVELLRSCDSSRSAASDPVSPFTYQQAITMFRSIYALLRVLPAAQLTKKLQAPSCTASNNALALEMKVEVGNSNTNTFYGGCNRLHNSVTDFAMPLSRNALANATSAFAFPCISSPAGNLSVSVTYRRYTDFTIQSREPTSFNCVSGNQPYDEIYSIPFPSPSRALSAIIHEVFGPEAPPNSGRQLTARPTETEPACLNQTSRSHVIIPQVDRGSEFFHTSTLLSTPVPVINDITGLVSLLHDHPIGFGGFGDVFIGIHTLKGKVALKRPRLRPDNVAILRRFNREVNLWRQVSHPSVLPFLGICTIHNEMYMVSPFIEDGDLANCLQEGRPLDRVKMIRQISEAVAYLHSQGIIHGDIKAQNVLLSAGGSALLSDFGLSKAFGQMVTSSENRGKGSTRWMAPELLEGEPKTQASDTYAFGMTVAEVLSGRPPYANIYETSAVMLAVLWKNERPPRVPARGLDGTPYGLLWDTAERCWVRKAVDRPSMEETAATVQNTIGRT